MSVAVLNIIESYRKVLINAGSKVNESRLQGKAQKNEDIPPPLIFFWSKNVNQTWVN